MWALRPLARTRCYVMRHSRVCQVPLGSAGEKGTRGATTLSPRPRMAVTASLPGNGGWPAGHGACRWPRRPFLPALRSVFATGREAAFSAAGGSLGSRYQVLLVSVSALTPVYRGRATGRIGPAALRLPVVLSEGRRRT